MKEKNRVLSRSFQSCWKMKIAIKQIGLKLGFDSLETYKNLPTGWKMKIAIKQIALKLDFESLGTYKNLPTGW